jgi:hypothetical protein
MKTNSTEVDVVRFNLKKLSELEMRKQYQTETSNRFAAFKTLNDSEDINRTCKITEGNIKISAKDTLGLCEQEQHKPWSDEEWQQLLPKEAG